MYLNNITIKNLKTKDSAYKVKDGGNLYLHISTAGSKTWYATYRFCNKRRQASLGKYPVVTLKDAREKNLEIRRLVENGIDPVQQKKQQKIEHEMQYDNSFEIIANEWHENKKHTWQPKHAETILIRLSTYLFPIIGQKPITEITPPELLHAIRPIEKAGKHEMAHRMLQTASQIFRYAVACGKASRDITIDLKGALKPTKSKNYVHLKESELPNFLRKLNKYDLRKEDGGCNGNDIIKWGFQLLIMTFVRTGELRGMSWTELDFDKKQWRIPAERMKMRDPHIIPLSTHAIALLRKIKEITGDSYSGYVFPSFQNPQKTISENTFLRAIDLMGYKGKTVGHGFRSTASTILNENGFRSDVIERQLAHAERNQVRAAYNHAEYLDERMQMMQWWSDYLITNGMDV